MIHIFINWELKKHKKDLMQYAFKRSYCVLLPSPKQSKDFCKKKKSFSFQPMSLKNRNFLVFDLFCWANKLLLLILWLLKHVVNNSNNWIINKHYQINHKLSQINHKLFHKLKSLKTVSKIVGTNELIS